MANKVPEGWKTLSLSNLARFHNGRAFKPADLGSKGLPVVRIGQLTGTAPEFDFYSGDDVKEEHLLQDGDLIFSWSATLMVKFWGGGSAVLNQHLFKVAPKPGNDLHFLKFVLEDSIDALADASHGSTMRHIRRSELKFHRVNIPPLPEQKKIAAILSSVDEAIEATEAVIEQTRTVKKGLLQELLTRGIGHSEFKKTPIGEIPKSWEVKKLGDLVVAGGLQTGPFGTQLHAAEYVDKGIPVVMPRDIDSTRILRTNIAYISLERAQTLKKHHLQIGDIVFARRGDIGRCALVETEDLMICGTGCLRARPDKSIWPEYLISYLQSWVPQHFLHTNAVGQTMLNLNTSILASVPIAVPPKDEQIQIASVLETITAQIEEYRESIIQLRSVKKGLLQDLLTGKVRVKSAEGAESEKSEELAEAMAE